MRIRRTAVLTVACTTGLLGLAAPAHAETAATLYVKNGTDVPCSDTGPGTQEQPFCSIGAAAAVAVPGQTVDIAAGRTYTEQIAPTRSGEPGRPITFRSSGLVNIQSDATRSRAAIAVSGVHDLVFENVRALGGVTVDQSDRIAFNKVPTAATGTRPGVLIGGASHDVVYTRSFIATQSGNPQFRIEGATGTVLSRNQGSGASLTPSVMFSVADAPKTTITNNSSDAGCGVVLSGGSIDSNIFNNIFAAATPATTCSGEKQPPISVAATAVPGTRVGYNLLNAAPGTALYSWAGTDHTDPEQFRTATGQGTNDLVAPTGQAPNADKGPAVDSADATAPGVIDADRSDAQPADDPRVPNTGTGYGYLDRGPYEKQDRFNGVTLLSVTNTWAPYGTKVTAAAWADDLWPAALTYTFDFGDGTQVTTKETVATHIYSSPCACKVKVTGVNGAGVSKVSNPVDVKVTTPGPIVPPLSATPALPLGNDPISHTPPLSVAVDAPVPDSAWPIASYAYSYGDGSLTESTWSNGRHTYAKPGDYQITVTVRDIKGNIGTASTTFHAEYSKATYTPVSPFRVIDTRSSPSILPGGGSITLNVSNGYPGGDKPVTSGSPEAVVLNVTATNATADTYLTLFPSGQDRPTASNLNVKAGQTVANLVTVPVGSNGMVELFNFSGRTDVVVDFVGYYQPNAGQGFTATGPARLSDAPMAAGATSTLKVVGKAGVPADATAVVVNLTADKPTANGYLTAYPHGINRPTVSSLNFRAGQTIANQAIVPVGVDGSIDLYNFTGNTRVVVDVFGYYSPGSKGLFTPAAPVRLTDTRYDNTKQPLGPGAQLNLPVAGTHGVPADATAAVLNAVLQPRLTVWPDLTTRPNTSNLNLAPGVTTPNHVTTPLGTNGRANIYNFSGNTHVVADLAGWFTNN
ncbi:PKD domain-containing protein [Kitasatospora sp. KL5]|uniref:PKD domain-containing protein n=1 Tax=Kitasatospora sp. KL5 TaxID=3425125 RepID=UPI003D700D05